MPKSEEPSGRNVSTPSRAGGDRSGGRSGDSVSHEVPPIKEEENDDEMNTLTSQRSLTLVQREEQEGQEFSNLKDEFELDSQDQGAEAKKKEEKRKNFEDEGNKKDIEYGSEHCG